MTTKHKERPILFNAPMVRALLDGSKTQTRRVVKHAPTPWNPAHTAWDMTKCQHGQVGDQLWVRETFLIADERAAGRPPWVYAADYPNQDRPKTRWKPSIFMPRAASRITLEITNVRVERLQDITRGDCMAEGCPFPNIAKETDPKQWYRDLWESLNDADSWDKNPWVWVIEFKKVKP